MRKKTTFFFIALTVLSMVFTGANLVKADEVDPFADVVPFIFGTGSSPPGFDPLAVYDSTSGDILMQHTEGLFSFNYSDPALGLEPRLAVDMGTWNDAGTEWTIEIRKDVLFHDGTAMKASDVKWNWDRLNTLSADDLCDHASLWFNDEAELILNRTEEIDDYTIKFVLNKAWKDFELLQSFWGCYIIKPQTDKEDDLIGGDELDLIVGTGPFVLDEYVAGEKTVFVANNDYYRGAPDIQKLIFQIYASGTAYNNAFLAKEAHVIPYVYFDNWAAVSADINLDYYLRTLPVCFFYHLNVHNIDWPVRKAMQYAYNYPYLIASVWDNVYLEHHTPVPAGMIGYNPDLEGLPYYNITLAREYLINDETYGYGDAIDALVTAGTLNISDDDSWKALAASDPLATHNFTHYGTGLQYQLIDNMEYCGISVVDNVVGDWGTFLHSNLEDLEIVMGGWGPDYFHPINQIEPLFGTQASANYNGLNDTAIDALMGQAHTLTGAALETKIDEIVTAIIVEEAAAMYYTQRRRAIGWVSEVVSNVNDLFNGNGDPYFYNVEFALSDPPATGIPGFTMISLALSAVGTAAFLFLRKRK